VWQGCHPDAEQSEAEGSAKAAGKLILLMLQELFVTEDGSHSIRVPHLNVTYHSKHGAIKESVHVFIESGLNYLNKKEISVLEVGFGTGLNALLTLIEADKNGLKIIFDVVELYPLDSVCVSSLNYLSILKAPRLAQAFAHMHACEWDVAAKISGQFELKKIRGDIRYVELTGNYDIVYFDAFDPVVQPELWTVDVFRKIFNVATQGCVLVTYCSKGIVRRAMTEAGFSVSKIAGPKGKREIVRAVKK
jgi:tRNA U34 5-methylaminomethyl-2-thiouridine-forming methyltransferase MnmC